MRCVPNLGDLARLALSCLAISVWTAGALSAQQSQYPQSGPMPVNQAPGLPASPAFVPETQLAPVTPRSAVATPNPPSSMLGSPVFDPYQQGAGAGNLRNAAPAPYQQPAPYAGGGLGSMFSGIGAPFNGGAPVTTPSYGGSPLFGGGSTAGFPATPPPGYGYPPATVGPPSYATPNSGAIYGAPATIYPPTAYPNQAPSTLFPGGIFGSGGMLSGNGGWGSSLPEPFRLFQGPRLRHTWLAGGDSANDLDMNQTDVSFAIAMPNFLYSTQPLFILPSFTYHSWDGPQGAAGGAADLPSKLYDAFLDFGWQSDPQRIVGAELGLRVGVFTDFETINSESLRVRGRALGIFRLSPMSTFKLGVLYADRNDIKLLPAGGLLYQPNPYTRLDITFPDPKFSRYLRTVGVYDTWGYIAGEFGGGSWTLQRASGADDSVDINDYRLLLGVEWGRSDLIRSGRRTGFAEVGYVFGREVEYQNNPADNFDPNDTFLLRVGIGY